MRTDGHECRCQHLVVQRTKAPRASTRAGCRGFELEVETTHVRVAAAPRIVRSVEQLMGIANENGFMRGVVGGAALHHRRNGASAQMIMRTQWISGHARVGRDASLLHAQDHFTFSNRWVQFVSHVLPPSAEKACSQRGMWN